MTVRTRAQLQAEATLISEETAARANTAQRVGGAMLDLAQSAKLVGENDTLGYNVQDFGALPSATAAVNNVAIQTAVTAAVATGGQLFWPPGVYLTSVSIANLHAVRHRGGGAIQRGSDVFYVDPTRSQTNRLHCSAAGTSGNDGLSAAEPTTLAMTAACLANYGPMLDGNWRIVVAAGTIEATNISFTTPSRSLVYVQGPDVGGPPNVPTAIISGAAAGASDFGLRASGPGVQVVWKDLKFDGYDTSVNNIALLCDYGADLWWDNIHVTNSTGQGIYGEDCPIVRGGGMIIDGCRQGILLNACNMVTLGYGYSDVTKNVVKNCTQAGVEWSRGTNGHCDYVKLQGNAVGIDVMHASRVHIYTSTFDTNVVAIRARSGGYYLDDASTYTTNTENWKNYAGTGETDSDLWSSISERRRGYSANGFNITGAPYVGAPVVVVSPWTIPQNFFITPTAGASTKKIRVVVHGQFTTAAALSRIGVSFDSVVIDQTVAVAPGANSKFKYEVEIWADGNAAQFKSAVLYQGGAAPAIVAAQNSPAQNMANAARNVNITAQLAAAGDVMTIDRTEVWVSG